MAEDLLKDFYIHSYSIGGKDDNGVTISGHKILANGKAFNFNTPFTLFDEENDEQTTGYKFADHLIKVIDEIEVEVRACLNGTKKSGAVQGTLPYDDETNR